MDAQVDEWLRKFDHARDILMIFNQFMEDPRLQRGSPAITCDINGNDDHIDVEVILNTGIISNKGDTEIRVDIRGQHVPNNTSRFLLSNPDYYENVVSVILLTL